MRADGENRTAAGTLADTDHVADFIDMNIGQTYCFMRSATEAALFSSWKVGASISQSSICPA